MPLVNKLHFERRILEFCNIGFSFLKILCKKNRFKKPINYSVPEPNTQEFERKMQKNNVKKLISAVLDLDTSEYWVEAHQTIQNIGI